MKILLILAMISFNVFASEEVAKLAESKKDAKTEVKDDGKDLLDFSSIKDIIKKDGLEGQLQKKQTEKRVHVTTKKLDDFKRYNVPTQAAFWSMMSEYWLVKNATLLKWDFHKPDFDLEKSFISLLEAQGHYEKKVKILLLDTTEIIHAALPSNDDEYIFLLSLPFIRTLDLSKIEISLILFEDFIRARKGYFKNYVLSKDLEGYLGTNFNGKPFNKKIMNESLKKYTVVLMDKGFSFQEQFETTTEMDALLKNDLKMWNTYLTLLEKVDNLTKSNALYKKYAQIYPSPELQLNWLRPKPSRF
ncbi:MAG: hypothetical protein H7336_16865 [Bacteriovorax sp.]|nr:hypothetical protein [Bacteriovorax sp.]